MPYIALTAIQTVDKNYIEFTDSSKSKPRRDEESKNIVYIDRDKAILKFAKGALIPDGVLTEEDVKIFLSHGAIEEDFDIRHRPSKATPPPQANKKPSGYEETK